MTSEDVEPIELEECLCTSNQICGSHLQGGEIRYEYCDWLNAVSLQLLTN